MRKRLTGWVFAAAVAVLPQVGANVAAAGFNGHGDSGICPIGFESRFNVNEIGCTFCNNPDPNECAVKCLAPPTCTCPIDDNLDSCCASTPCCENCPPNTSLECNLLTCECMPETCCQTICPVAPSPVLGSPISLTFGLVAVALAGAGTFLLMRQRGSGQRRRQVRI